VKAEHLDSSGLVPEKQGDATCTGLYQGEAMKILIAQKIAAGTIPLYEAGVQSMVVPLKSGEQIVVKVIEVAAAFDIEGLE